ncbi:hypothetical protein SETIT_9G530300v2 [Setaria italica]|uniref:Uncharacterized protein n=2 Tax=Setaria TaxID=4554 RepID=A0A368SVF9_SETIT|nr:hypothetical protein SETIT_9G530300v2 [Setaria italica]TKV98047.1 hypothetical protein SEVIR_9G534700v2 [Setaria viridis]
MAKAVLLAVVLMQCCNVILAARPLLEAAAVAGGDGGWLGLIRQVLAGPPQNGNPCCRQGS